MEWNIGSKLYWDEVMNYLNNNDNVYNLPEWKYIKEDQDNPKQQNGRT